MQVLPGNIEIENNHIEKEIWEKLLIYFKNEDNSIIGYQKPSLGLSKEETVTFVIRSQQQGLIIIEVIKERIIKFNEDFWETSTNEIYSRDNILQDFVTEIKNRLSKHKELFDRKEKKFKIPIIPILIFPENKNKDIPKNFLITEKYFTSDNISNLSNEFQNNTIQIKDIQFDILNSILDGTIPFNKRLRKKQVEVFNTINDFIQKSLEETFKLDAIQRSIAMQIPNGPQRIRGLAGTGKTVILSMKAAIAHKDNPDFKILFLFNTQSMYNQIEKYIYDYYLNEAKSYPTENLEILHSWGGKRTRMGLYSKLCEIYGIVPKTFFDAKHSNDALEFIYKDFLNKTKNKLEPIYDLVLIDEAQDFSPAIFETIYYITKDPKRIVWAYDEFQSLKELKIKEPEELFGKNHKGKPNMSSEQLKGVYSGGIKKDFVLPNSYRNPRLNLMVAHGIGLGIYTKEANIAMKESVEWTARGYKIIKPDKRTFEKGDKIIVERPESNSRNILEYLLKSQGEDELQLVKYNFENTIKDELNYVITNIYKLITEQKVEPEEIIIIDLNTKAKEELEYIRKELLKYEIASITPGFIEKTDKFKEKGRVTLATPFRAKGNEANVVFVINAQKVVNDITFNSRNALFVSITRSRGWCFISGNGKNGEKLKKEINNIIKNYPKFEFNFPDENDRQRILKIINSKKDLERAEKEIDKILKDETLKALLLEKLKQERKDL